jgi:hypothetical protein
MWDDAAGEALWNGKWVPSCIGCATRLRALWRETIHDNTCEGCSAPLHSVWIKRPERGTE